MAFDSTMIQAWCILIFWVGAWAVTHAAMKTPIGNPERWFSTSIGMMLVVCAITITLRTTTLTPALKALTLFIGLGMNAVLHAYVKPRSK